MTIANGRTTDIATPLRAASFPIRLFAYRGFTLLAARVGIAVAKGLGKPLRLGTTIIAATHTDVREVLERDLDFIIQPVDGPRFDEIGYHFILGMDRSEELFRERHALYAALAKVDPAPIREAAGRHIADRLAAAPDRTIDVVEDYARPIAAATATAYFGIGPADHALFMDAARAIFGHCFLNIAGDRAVAARAIEAARIMSGWFDDEIARRRTSGDLGDDMMGALLQAGVSDDLTRRTLGGMLVGSIDTTATVVAQVMTVLMHDPALLASATRDRGDLAKLYGWCLEALRLWPQTPALARQAASDTMLRGVAVPAGARVILWTQAAMFDATAFPDPLRSRRDREAGVYLHLGGGLHPCAGRAINAWQIPMLVAGLLELSPTRLGRLRWAGPFPARLPLSWKDGAR